MTREAGIWMPWYWADYLRDTAHLDTTEHGAYMLLIGHYWTNGKRIADADKRLAAVTGMTIDAWKEIRPTIEEFFTVEDGFWHHVRIDAELKTAETKASRRSEAGKRGAKARWQSDGNANAIANGKGNGPAVPSRATQSQSQSEEESVMPPSAAAKSEMPPIPTALQRRPDAKGQRLPKGWTPDEQGARFAHDRGLAVGEELDQFSDHWTAKSGKDASKRDWNATWRTWCRNSAKWKAERGPKGHGVGGSVDAARALMASGSPEN
jgi:uncharacterized protein YdaU (DUF1376 family)